MVLLCATLPPRSLDSRFQETPCVDAGFSLVARAPHPPSAPSPRSSRGEGQQGTCLARIWFVAPLVAGEKGNKAQVSRESCLLPLAPLAGRGCRRRVRGRATCDTFPSG